MALSEREQQLLAEMEQALREEDPRFASQMNGEARSPEDRRRLVVGVVGALAGLGLVIAGITTYLWIGVLGFVLIVVSVALALTPGGRSPLGIVEADGSVREARGPRPARPARAGRLRRPASGARGTGSRPGGGAVGGGFMERLERRWAERRPDRRGW